MTKTTQEMIERAQYNALTNKKANASLAKSLGISEEEVLRRIKANNKELFEKFGG